MTAWLLPLALSLCLAALLRAGGDYMQTKKRAASWRPQPNDTHAEN